MKLVGLMPVRNEDWVIGCSLRVALKWCDDVLVFLHNSQDRSQAIARDIYHETPRVHFFHSFDPEWNEMAHRQTMLDKARALDATHIAIIDADEILTSNLYEQARDWSETLPRETMLFLPGYNLRGGLHQYHTNGVWGQRWFSTVFRDDPKLEWRGDMYHHREPFGAAWRFFRPCMQGAGGVLHLWGASERRLRAKHALYKITERLRWPDKATEAIELMYNLAIYPEASAGKWETQWCYAATPARWLPEQDLMDHRLCINAEPWQEAECRRLVEEHGRERFTGLDLFGVA